jgi:hypothetical protein
MLERFSQWISISSVRKEKGERISAISSSEEYADAYAMLPEIFCNNRQQGDKLRFRFGSNRLVGDYFTALR